MNTTTTSDVWDVLADSPDEAENLRLRANLMSRTGERIERNGWSQRVAAQSLELTQPRVSDLTTGKIDKFSLDELVNIGAKIGVHLRVVSDEPTAETLTDTHQTFA